MASKDRETWLTVGKIGKYCNVSRATVRRWIKTEGLSAIRLPGGHYRVTIEEFKDFLRRHDMPIREDYLGPEDERSLDAN
jgi:excisionase family DNA binding protein